MYIYALRTIIVFLFKSENNFIKEIKHIFFPSQPSEKLSKVSENSQAGENKRLFSDTFPNSVKRFAYEGTENIFYFLNENNLKL